MAIVPCVTAPPHCLLQCSPRLPPGLALIGARVKQIRHKGPTPRSPVEITTSGIVLLQARSPGFESSGILAAILRVSPSLARSNTNSSASRSVLIEWPRALSGGHTKPLAPFPIECRAEAFDFRLNVRMSGEGVFFIPFRPADRS